MSCQSFFQLKSTFSSDSKDVESKKSESADIDQLEHDSMFEHKTVALCIFFSRFLTHYDLLQAERDAHAFREIIISG